MVKVTLFGIGGTLYQVQVEESQLETKLKEFRRRGFAIGSVKK